MKYVILLISATAYAQTGQICYAPDKASPAKVACRDISPALKASLAAYAASKNRPASPVAPALIRYIGVGDLIMSTLSGLFEAAVEANPPAAVQSAKADEATARALADKLKAAIVDRKQTQEPQ